MVRKQDLPNRIRERCGWYGICAAFILLSVTVSGAHAAEAEDPKELARRRAEIAKCIQDLASEQWRDRAAAMQALRKHGAEALPQLSAVDVEDNAELARRVRDLIREASMATSGELKLLVGDLMKAYPHQDPTGRVQTIRIVVDRAGGSCVPLLLGLLDREEDQLVQAEIVRQLGWQVADPNAQKVLVRFYQRCPDSIKGSALWALAATPTETSRRLAREALKSDSTDIQAAAIRAIMRMGDRDSLPELRVLANPKEEDVGSKLHVQALRALISLMDEESGPLFRSCLQGTSEMKQEGLRGIAGLRDRSAAPELIKMLNDDSNKELRDEIIQTMGSVRDPAFVPLLLSYLTKEPASIRIEAIQALQQMEVKTAAPKVAALLDDADETVRRVAVEAVAFFKYKEAIPKIRTMLDGTDSYYRWSVIQALANLGDPKGVEAIIQLARTGRTRLAEQATRLIGEWHLAAGVPVLRERASRGDEAALEALLQFGHDPHAFRALLRRYFASYLMAPKSFPAVWSLGRLLEERGLADRAVKLMQTVVQRTPRHENALMMLANFSHQAGLYAKCEATYKRAEGVIGTRANYLNNRAWFYCTSFKKEYLRPERSLTLVRRAVAMEPQSPYYVDTLGWALHVSGKYDEAVVQLRRALDLKDAADRAGCSWQRTRIARSLWAAGKKKEALADVARALVDAPHDDKVWFEAAGFYAWCGHRDDSIHAIHKAIDVGFIDVPSMTLNPEFDSLRKDPGWLYAMQRANRSRAAVERIVDAVEAEVREALKRGRAIRMDREASIDESLILDRY